MGSYRTRHRITPFCRQCHWMRQWGVGTGALGRRVSAVHQRTQRLRLKCRHLVTAFERVLRHWNARHRVQSSVRFISRGTHQRHQSHWLPSWCSSEMCSQQTDFFQTLWEAGCERLSCRVVAEIYLSPCFVHWCCTCIHTTVISFQMPSYDRDTEHVWLVVPVFNILEQVICTCPDAFIVRIYVRWNHKCAYNDMNYHYCQPGIISWRPCWIYAILDPADRPNSSSIVFPVSEHACRHKFAFLRYLF